MSKQIKQEVWDLFFEVIDMYEDGKFGICIEMYFLGF